MNFNFLQQQMLSSATRHCLFSAATLPGLNIQKMNDMLLEAELEPGLQDVKLKTVQRLRGLGTHFAATNQALGTELGAVDASARSKVQPTVKL